MTIVGDNYDLEPDSPTFKGKTADEVMRTLNEATKGEKEVVKVINGSPGLKRTEITGEELERLRDEYLKEMTCLSHKTFKIVSNEFCGNKETAFRVLLEKIVPPFEYWLRDKIAADFVNEKRKR